MTPRLLLLPLLLTGGALFLGAEAAADPAALPDERCENVLVRAQEQYVARSFAMARLLIEECLASRVVDDESDAHLHRLLALVLLRQDDTYGAEGAVVRLLSLDPEFEPDPVDDPPAFVGLVAAMKVRLRRAQLPAAARAAEPEPTEAAVPPAERPRYDVALSVGGGIGSYGGERGVQAQGGLEEFFSNGGPLLDLRVTVARTAAPRYALGLGYQPVRWPTLLNASGRSGGGEGTGSDIDPDRSTPWGHLLTLFGQGAIEATPQVSPYARFGLTAALNTLNDDVRLGVGPSVAAGAEVEI
ncbi:MAG: hypothetical protein R3362_12345, partial [Rhodothermales bacterium]|nr:hypothetical protein [Rhodothermales bacterium]